jgi:4-amino-4-deoxy-L-arabinose transferase-like glycosyltransferase
VTQASEPHTLGWRAGLLVFALALAWRFAYLGVAAMEAAFYAPALDSYWHVQWGSAIAHGTLWLSEPFFRAPLYPYFLGALLWVFNGDLLLVRVAQIFVGAGSATLGAVLGARLFGRWVGVVAGVLLASATSLVMFDLELLIAVILVPLVICALLAIERATRAPSISAWLTVGLLLGATAIARPNILLFVPVALLLLTLAARAHGWRGWRLTAGLLVVLGGVALPIAPVTVHNAVVGRDLVLISSQGGVNFYIGNNADADGFTARVVGPSDTEPYAPDGTYTDNVMSSARYVASQTLGRPLKASEISRFWFRKGLDWIRAEPVAWMRLTLRKAFYLTSGFEIGDNKNLTYYLESWRPFAFLPRWWWLFPLALAGLSLAGAPRARLLLVLFLLTYGASIVGFFANERFRLVLYPVLCILAARFVVWVPTALRQREWRALGLRVALVLTLILWTRFDPTGYTYRERIASLVVRAGQTELAGDSSGAERLYRAAVGIDTTSEKARRAYVGFLVRHGRMHEAGAISKRGRL